MEEVLPQDIFVYVECVILVGSTCLATDKRIAYVVSWLLASTTKNISA